MPYTESKKLLLSYKLTMPTKLAKSTSKGQITLPKEWRDQFKTENFIMEFDPKQIVIKPIQINELASEEIIFDADIDNNGKGISPDEMIKMLKKIKNG
ncbi:MAG: hypothetical protein WC806_01910 [Candidatus Gracilibacteria bacterium]|jgi:bifunctional DNA-binding transcriptional regulator/antitoxin component of YhaV-PrlF toxin-antitoxin module